MTSGSTSTPVRIPTLKSIVPALFFDGLCPYLTYLVATRYSHTSELVALCLSAIVPAVKGLTDVIRRARIDFIGAVVLAGVAVSAAAVLIGGRPRLILIRESFVTGTLGMLALSSLTWKRPLLFYIGRQFSAGDDAAAIARFNALWNEATVKHTFRVLTLVWAVGWMGEFALRLLMVLTLSTAEVLALSPFVFNGVTLALIGWTVAYTRRRQQRRASTAA
jgi:hypothetical protein